MKIRELFDRCATEYDRDRPKLVPCFDNFYGTVLQQIPFPSNAGIRVLELGAGTGLLAAMVERAFPAAALHLNDISNAMLDQARLRFTGNPRVTFKVQSHLELSAASEYDLVLSALSIHHLPHGDKQELFHRIFAALHPGGMFINADQALAPDPPGEAAYERQWVADVTANGATEEVLQKARERMREDKNALLSDQLQWLSDAGFTGVECWYQRYRFVVYGGSRPLL